MVKLTKNRTLVIMSEQMGLKNFTEQTQRSYLWHIEKFLMESVSPTEITNTHVNKYLISVSDKSDSWRNQSINAIRFLFQYVLNKKIKVWLVIRPKKAKTQPILLSDEEVELLFSKVHNIKHKVIMALLYSGGLRVSEVINLRITDIDSKCMVVRIKSGKGRKDRMVQLHPSVLELLRVYYLGYKPVTWLFNGVVKGTQYSARSIEKFVADLGRECGIAKRVYPHLIRHQYITDMLENNVDIYTAQLLAGHSRTITTIGYGHLRDKFISKVYSPVEKLKLVA